MGSTQIETSQSKLYAHYFKGAAGTTGYIGFVSGLDIGLGRVFNVVSKLASVPIAERTGNFAWSFWVPLIICAFTLLLNIVYVLFARTLPVQNRVLTGKRAAALAREGQTPITGLANKRSRFSYLGLFALPACFWILPLTQLLQAGTVGAYVRVPTWPTTSLSLSWGTDPSALFLIEDGQSGGGRRDHPRNDEAHRRLHQRNRADPPHRPHSRPRTLLRPIRSTNPVHRRNGCALGARFLTPQLFVLPPSHPVSFLCVL